MENPLLSYSYVLSCEPHSNTFQTTKIKKRNNKLADKRMRLKHRQKINYDKTARRLEPLQERDVVKIEGSDCWDRKAIVLSEVGPRSIVLKGPLCNFFSQNYINYAG